MIPPYCADAEVFTVCTTLGSVRMSRIISFAISVLWLFVTLPKS
ncbi:hypothetical protein K388_03733 [Streptomyces sp. KhCrAH-43]|nr:hypothetical protein K388_03733 [Streptomyces sp. KhCrAH-43]